MANPHDLRNEQSARAHMLAAKAAPHRKELELNQAENFARLIQDKNLQKKVMDDIAKARKS